MKYLKKFNESNSEEETQKFLNKSGIKNFRINSDGSVDVPGDVRISIDGEIPFKFGNIDGVFNIITNSKDWSFMPETAKKYIIRTVKIDNDFWKRYTNLSCYESDKYDEFRKKGFDTNKNKVLSDYYLEFATNNGLLNTYSKESDDLVWEDAKGEFFDKSNLSIIDYPIFAQYDDVDFEEILKSAKSGDMKSCEVLVGILSNDDGFYKNKFEKFHLGEVYEQIKSQGGFDKILNRHFLKKMCDYISLNLHKDKRTIERDKKDDCYVFIARDGFKENKDGSYKKFLDIENMFKIDIYDPSTYTTIGKMKMRVRFNNESKLWMIWLPKDFFKSEDRIEPNDVQLDIINKYKEELR